MNYRKNFASAVAIFAMSLPMLSSAQSFEDHTKIRQLIGKPPAIPIGDIPSCPAGSTLSGNECVLISNQQTGTKSWTYYFRGQTKCWQNVLCASIRDDGLVSYKRGGFPTVVFDVPAENAPMILDLIGGSCGDGDCSSPSRLVIGPQISNANRLNGTAPESWFISLN